MPRFRFRLGAGLPFPLFLLVLFAAGRAFAVSGNLDPTFGQEGVAVAAFDTSTALALARQPDGKLVAAGGSTGGAAVAVARFDANGVLDPSFGGDGIVTTDVGPLDDVAVQVLVHTDGTIVVVANEQLVENVVGGNIVVIRYLADGSLDPSFADSGIAITPLGVLQGARSGALQSDGKIIVVGGVQTTALTSGDLFVLRYDSDGVLDQTFGDEGLVTLDFGDRGDSGGAVVIQPDGMIVVAGTSFDGPLFSDGSIATLTRLDSIGAPDPLFGSGGSVEIATHPVNVAKSLLLEPDGDLVLLAGNGTANVTYRLFRYDGDGALDPGFTSAIIPVGPQANTPGSAALLPDGKFAVVGNASGRHFQVARMNADGSVDATFGAGGKIEVATGVNDQCLAVVGEPSGDIVVAGASRQPGTPRDEADLTVARLLGASDACVVDADCAACERCGAGVCEIGPRTGCTNAATRAAQIKIVQKYGRGDRLKVKWRGTVPAFDPLASDDLGVCLFRDGLRYVKAVAPAGGLCDGAPCWTGASPDLEYDDRDATPHGIRSIDVAADRLKLQARGEELSASPQGVPETLHLGQPGSDPILVQLQAGNGACVEATFDSGRKTSPNRFSAKND